MIDLIFRKPTKVIIFEPGDIPPNPEDLVYYPRSDIWVAILPLEEASNDHVRQGTKTTTYTGAIELCVPRLVRH